MTGYTLYLEGDLNRVFTGSLAQVAAAELRLVADGLLPDRVGPITSEQRGRTPVLQFEGPAADAELESLIGQLSASAALFAADADGDGKLLRPVPIDQHLTYGTDLVTTQRYRGKTSERLTRAMVNLGLAASGRPLAIDPTSPPTVLDPMCGRGTTLNWMTAYGGHAVGIERDAASLDHYATFLQTWAKRSRLPHKAIAHRKGNAEQRHLTMRIATDRATLKADRGQRIETFLADGTDPSVPIPRHSVDSIVADLPYGVQHDDRTVTDLVVADGLAAWKRWLRPGGSLCLAWNAKRTPRPTMVATLTDGGFTVIEPADGLSMAHTVDATIHRDVVVARLSD